MIIVKPTNCIEKEIEKEKDEPNQPAGHVNLALKRLTQISDPKALSIQTQACDGSSVAQPCAKFSPPLPRVHPH